MLVKEVKISNLRLVKKVKKKTNQKSTKNENIQIIKKFFFQI